ncbi:MAG: hypothetical protein Q4Q04_02440 [Methanocorpusculum sp.]|nr:hypothetical protein [Methanocorpusculum sp.]
MKSLPLVLLLFLAFIFAAGCVQQPASAPPSSGSFVEKTDLPLVAAYGTPQNVSGWLNTTYDLFADEISRVGIAANLVLGRPYYNTSGYIDIPLPGHMGSVAPTSADGGPAKPRMFYVPQNVTKDQLTAVYPELARFAAERGVNDLPVVFKVQDFVYVESPDSP